MHSGDLSCPPFCVCEFCASLRPVLLLHAFLRLLRVFVVHFLLPWRALRLRVRPVFTSPHDPSRGQTVARLTPRCHMLGCRSRNGGGASRRRGCTLRSRSLRETPGQLGPGAEFSDSTAADPVGGGVSRSRFSSHGSVWMFSVLDGLLWVWLRWVGHRPALAWSPVGGGCRPVCHSSACGLRWTATAWAVPLAARPCGTDPPDGRFDESGVRRLRRPRR
jgi:hypothetical protein